VLLKCALYPISTLTGNQDNGQSPARKVVGCANPPVNQGSLLGHEHTDVLSTALHGVSELTHLEVQEGGDRVHVEGVPASNTFIPLSQGSDSVFIDSSLGAGPSTHVTSSPHIFITNQKVPCPSCGIEMLGKNINRHLERSCKQAPPGAHISFRPARNVPTPHPPPTSVNPNPPHARVSCPHCHSTFSNAGNLKRHLGTCKIFPNTHHTMLPSDGVLPHLDNQTAVISGFSPTTQHSPHTGSTHHSPRIDPSGLVGGDSESPLIHTPMTALEHDTPCLHKHPKLHCPATGTPAGKSKWDIIDGNVARELPYVYRGQLRTLSEDEAVDTLHVFIRSMFPPAPVIHAHGGNHRPHSLIPPGIRRRQRELRREWNRRGTLPEDTVESLRTEYHVLRRQIRRRVRLANLQNDLVQRGHNTRKFRQDPHRFASALLNQQHNHEPQFDKAAADAHFSKVYTDTDRSYVYEGLPTLPPVPLPTSIFSDAPPTLQELRSVLRKARNKSAPGPSGIPYVVYKMLPSLLPTLHALFVKVWKSQQVPLAWRVAHMILLAKSSDTSSPAAMRNIALGNSEGKLFFAIVAHRIQRHMIGNLYFDGVTQKGFMPGVAGCVEHASVMREALGDARRRRKSICVTWVDFANAFGSVRHSLIQFALKHYHFSDQFCSLIYHYYDKLFAVVHTKQFSTEPFHYGVGVFQGCTTSPALFNVVMQILLDIINRPANKHLAYTFPSSDPTSFHSLLSPTFADDVSIVTETADGNQHLLDETAEFCGWTRTMGLKPPKCFALAYKNFKGATSRYSSIDDRQWTAYNPCLVVHGHTLQLISGEGFKYLGKLLEINMNEVHLKTHIIDKLRSWMDLIDNCLLDRAMKCWIYNFTIISKLSWWFTVGDLSVDFSQYLHSIVLPYLLRWCGLPKSGANSAVLFVGSGQHLGMSLRRTYTVYKAMQVVRRGILKRSKDPLVRHVFQMEMSRQESWTGSRFAPALEVSAVEAQATLVEIPAHHHGLGYKGISNKRDKATTALQMYTSIDSQKQLEHASKLVMQGKLQLFDECLHRDWGWDKLLYNCSDATFKFMINSSNNTLPTGSNLKIWSNSVILTKCAGCRTPNPTLKHVLNGCFSFLKQGRYTWRHDRVLSDIYKGIAEKIVSIKAQDISSVRLPYIHFVAETQARHGRPAGVSASERRPLTTGLLHEAGDWEILADGVSPDYFFPTDIAITAMRPDICIFSRLRRRVVLIELTVPMEDRLTESATIKTAKYQELVNDISSNNWRCDLFTVEVGSRGNDAVSLGRCLTCLGFSRKVSQTLQRSVCDTSRRASYFIYLKRNDPIWVNPPR
jgi:hypothetical protein